MRTTPALLPSLKFSPRQLQTALAITAALAAPVALAAPPGPAGNEFQVNTYTTFNQEEQSVAIADDGLFVVAWASAGQDGSSHGIYAQRYDTAGVAQGGEFQVNTYTLSAQRDSSVAMNANGDFVIAWISFAQDGDGWGIYAQRFDAAGLPQGGEFLVNTHTVSGQLNPSVAMNADGAFIIAWDSYGQDGDGYGVYAQRYDALGAAQGGEIKVNSYTTSAQEKPSVAIAADGSFVVTWQSDGQDGSGHGVFAQRYDAAGLPQDGEFQVNSVSISAQGSPTVGMAADGRFVVAWHSFAQDGNNYGVFAQRFDAAGMAQGGELQVNTTTTANQDTPSLAMAAAGDFLVSWNSANQDGDGYGIYAQRFGAAGLPQGGEFQVNSFTAGEQSLPAVALNADGKYVVTWRSAGQDGNLSGIFAQRYKPAFVCPTVPAGSCGLAARSSLSITAGKSLTWNWSGSLTAAQLGNPLVPVSGTTHLFCLYTDDTLMSEADVAPGAGWVVKPNRVEFRVKPANPDGVLRTRLSTNSKSKGAALVTQDGSNLPPLPLSPVTDVTVQLLNDAGLCLEGHYSTPLVKNSGATVKRVSARERNP